MNNKLLLLTYVVFLSASVFFGCKYYKLKPDTPGIKQPQSCSTCGSNSDLKFEGIKASTAAAMSSNYKTNQLANITSAGSVTNDARSVWFPLETIKRFIYEIEKTTCSAGCNDKAFGIRIYFAAYPQLQLMTQNPDLGGLDPAYAKHHTLFMVPTYTDATSGGPIDFDPWHMVGCKATPYSKIMKWSPTEKSLILVPSYYSQSYQMNISNSTGTSTGTVLNHGGLCPPICQPPTGSVF